MKEKHIIIILMLSLLIGFFFILIELKEVVEMTKTNSENIDTLVECHKEENESFNMYINRGEK